jgi:hypothetical protein
MCQCHPRSRECNEDSTHGFETDVKYFIKTKKSIAFRQFRSAGYEGMNDRDGSSLAGDDDLIHDTHKEPTVY